MRRKLWLETRPASLYHPDRSFSVCSALSGFSSLSAGYCGSCFITAQTFVARTRRYQVNDYTCAGLFGFVHESRLLLFINSFRISLIIVKILARLLAAYVMCIVGSHGDSDNDDDTVTTSSSTTTTTTLPPKCVSHATADDTCDVTSSGAKCSHLGTSALSLKGENKVAPESRH